MTSFAQEKNSQQACKLMLRVGKKVLGGCRHINYTAM